MAFIEKMGRMQMGSVLKVKQRIEILYEYRKVARNSKPSLEAHAGFL